MAQFFPSRFYSSLPQTESACPAPISEKELGRGHQHVSFHKTLSFWVTTTIFFATLSILLGVRVQLYWPRREGSFEKGYHYELGKFRCCWTLFCTDSGMNVAESLIHEILFS
jgi:hypothetical protein